MYVSGFMWSCKAWKSHEILISWFPGLEKSWKSFKKCKKVMEIGNIPQKMTFWPNARCDIAGNILIHTDGPFLCARLGTKRSWNFLILSLKSHGKIIEFKCSEGAQILMFWKWDKSTHLGVIYAPVSAPRTIIDLRIWVHFKLFFKVPESRIDRYWKAGSF